MEAALKDVATKGVAGRVSAGIWGRRCTGEGHIITNPLLVHCVVKITKLWCKLGVWVDGCLRTR